MGVLEITVSAPSNMLATSYGKKLYVNARASSYVAFTFS